MDLTRHLLRRNYDPTRYMHQHLDHEDSVLTVLLCNLSGRFVGFQQYRANVTSKHANCPSEARYFTYSPRGVTACWGIETLDPSKKDLFIVEGIFKASALHMLGYNALAVLTSNPKPMKSWLHTMNYNLIGIGDSDKAGKYIPRIAGKGFQSDLDLDEYTLEELDKLIRSKPWNAT